MSHGHGPLVRSLLSNLATSFSRQSSLSVTLTLNVPEDLCVEEMALPFAVEVIRNQTPKGFGANHNSAFRLLDEQGGKDVFCVLNPDTTVSAGALVSLARRLAEEPQLGVLAPVVLDPSGKEEDSMRRLPTPWTLVRKLLGGREGNSYRREGDLLLPDWVAGVCMLFPWEVYRRFGGFDEKFWLYYEDVDLCCRVRDGGLRVAVDPDIRITHDARRSSRRDPRMLRFHIASAGRFFSSKVYWRCRRLARDRGVGSVAVRA